MELTDLKGFNKKVRKLILEYLEKNDMTLHKFCKKVGVHQSQMWIYLYGDNKKAGLHSRTLEKIGEII